MKRLIAPLIITVIVAVVFIIYLISYIWFPLPLWGKIMGMAGSLGLIGGAVYVFLERVKEIRSGEHNDLSKY